MSTHLPSLNLVRTGHQHYSDLIGEEMEARKISGVAVLQPVDRTEQVNSLYSAGSVI